MNNKGVWEVREWDGETWPEKRISVGWSNGGNAICMSPRYAEREETLKLFKMIAVAPETEAERDWLKEVNTDLIEALEELLQDYEDAYDEWSEEGALSLGEELILKAKNALTKAKGE